MFTLLYVILSRTVFFFLAGNPTIQYNYWIATLFKDSLHICSKLFSGELQPNSVPFSSKAMTKQIHFLAVWSCQFCSFNERAVLLKTKLAFLFWYVIFYRFEDDIYILRDYWRRSGLIFKLRCWGQLWLMLLISFVFITW